LSTAFLAIEENPDNMQLFTWTLADEEHVDDVGTTDQGLACTNASSNTREKNHDPSSDSTPSPGA
jgi:hypothetical protein